MSNTNVYARGTPVPKPALVPGYLAQKKQHPPRILLGLRRGPYGGPRGGAAAYDRVTPELSRPSAWCLLTMGARVWNGKMRLFSPTRASQPLGKVIGTILQCGRGMLRFCTEGGSHNLGRNSGLYTYI